MSKKRKSTVSAFQVGEDDTDFSNSIPPDFVDKLIRQAVVMCWTMLPKERRTVEAVESKIRQVVERVLSNLKEDSATFVTDPGKALFGKRD